METIWPNFFIVGARKAGTTSLYQYLKRHPQIYMSPRKETHFFSRDMVWTEPDMMISQESVYLDLFKNAGGYKIIGEGSPSYLWHEKVPYYIHEKIPQAKIIILLRDPIERAYSDYLMHYLNGYYNNKSFHLVLQEQYEKRCNVYGRGQLLIELGEYFSQVERYLHVFDPDQVKVILFEHLTHRPVETLISVANFAGIDSEPFIKDPSSYKIHNPYFKPRNRLVLGLMNLHQLRIYWRKIMPENIRAFVRYKILAKRVRKPPIDPDVVGFLKSIYSPEIDKLEGLLGYPLPELRLVW